MMSNMDFVSAVLMLLVQVGTALSAILLFRRIFAEENWKLPVFFGLLLYMTCPYRIYVCFELGDLSQAIVWMLMPLYAWGIMTLVSEIKKSRNTLVGTAALAIALAGMGYASEVFFVIFAGITLLAAVVKRSLWVLTSLLTGTVIFLPGLYRFLQYLFTERFAELNMQPQLIMKNGYRFGEFYTAYTWKTDHPGMGLGLMICLLAGIWLRFVQGQAPKKAENKWFLLVAVVSAVMSLCYFPWDFVQRLGVWALRFVTIMENPAIFWGISCAALSMVGAGNLEQISKNGNKLIAKAVPIIVMVFCVGGCIYQCCI